MERKNYYSRAFVLSNLEDVRKTENTKAPSTQGHFCIEGALDMRLRRYSVRGIVGSIPLADKNFFFPFSNFFIFYMFFRRFCPFC